MDKLKGLLKQLGGSDQLVGAITEELDRFTQETEARFEKQFHDRIMKARQVCLEEVQKEKVALARKFSIFLESKLETINKAAEKQRLQEDTEAQNMLKRTKALLEDVSLDDGGQSRELQAMNKKLNRLTRAMGTLKEERDMAVRKANSANDIALKTLQKNRLLESQVKAANVIAEDTQPKTPAQPKPKASTKKQSSKVLKESKPAKRRLSANRRVPSKSRTTRATLKESQVRSNSGGMKSGDSRIAGIAASIDTDE